MKRIRIALLVASIALLASCSKVPQVTQQPLVALPSVPRLTSAALDLIVEFEVGGRSGYKPRPEAPDARLSGITEGIGYDNSTVSSAVIVADWRALPHGQPQRLAATHPFTGRAAQMHLSDVHDIMVPWNDALDVFQNVDVARVWMQCRRAFPGFDALRPNAQGALLSLVFNRGPGMMGDSRREMRAIASLTLSRDYPRIASQLTVMPRVWQGTEIYLGMRRRRIAEAALLLTE